MSKTGTLKAHFSATSSTINYCARATNNFLHDLSRTVSFAFIKAALKNFLRRLGPGPLGPGAHVESSVASRAYLKNYRFLTPSPLTGVD